jgi:hypothetical protein
MTGGGRRSWLASNPLGRRHGLDVFAGGPRLQRFRLALLVGEVLVRLHEHESLLVGVRLWGVRKVAGFHPLQERLLLLLVLSLDECLSKPQPVLAFTNLLGGLLHLGIEGRARGTA